MFFLALLLSTFAYAEDNLFINRIASLSDHISAVRAVVTHEETIFSADMSGVVVASRLTDGGKLWSVNVNDGVAAFRAAFALGVSRDGRMLAVTGDLGHLVLLDALDGRIIRTMQEPSHNVIRSVAFANDGLSAATGGEDGSVRRWNLVNGATELVGYHDWSITDVRFSTDDFLLVGDPQGIKLWNLDTRRVVRVLLDPATAGLDHLAMGALGYSSDLNLVVAASGARALLFDLTTGRLVRAFDCNCVDDDGNPDDQAEVLRAELSADASELLVAYRQNLLLRWNVDDPAAPPAASGPLTFTMTSFILPIPDVSRLVVSGLRWNILAGTLEPSTGIWEYH